MATTFPMSADDMQRYAALMTQVKYRTEHALSWLEDPPTFPRLEAAAGQIRLMLETVMLGSIITNRSVLDQTTAALARADHERAWRLVKRRNPDYWPEPTRQILEGPGRYRWEPVLEGFLREEDYHRTWGSVSEWLHARNPYAALTDPVAAARDLRSTTYSIVRLLEHHSVHLLDRDYVLNCLMVGSDGLVHITAFQRLPDNGRRVRLRE